MDIFDYTDDFEFLKDFYHLQGKTIDWAIIEIYNDKDDDKPKPRGPFDNPYHPKSKFRPALLIEGSKVCVNLYDRCFCSPIDDYGGYHRYVYPANLVSAGHGGDLAVLEAKEDSTKYVILPNSFIKDSHRNCWYGEWMEDSFLF